MIKKIFVDSDIILDLYGKREPFYRFSAQLFSLIEKGRIKAYISPLIFSNLHYILRKLSNKEKALRHLRKLKLLVKIVPITERIIEFALSSEFNDFEDAIQYYAAKEKGLDYLITRSKKNYKKGIITILTAEEYLELFSRNGESQ